MFWMKKEEQKRRRKTQRTEQAEGSYKGGQRLRTARGLALLLSLLLCLEGAPLTALAAEPGLLANTAEPAEAPDGQQPPAGEGEISPAEGEEMPPADREETPSTEEGETAPAEGGETPPAGEETIPPSEGEGEEQTSPIEGGEMPPAEDGKLPPEKESEQVSGNDTDSVSENDMSSVSENAIHSVSENDPDAEREAMIEEAQEAFAVLAAEKPLMALLYHADSYNVRKDADAQSGTAATLEIGQTFYIQGVQITEDDVWYRTQYFLNGAEGTGYVQSYYLAYSDEDWLAWEEEYLLPILMSNEETYKNTAYGMQAYSMMPYAVDTSDVNAFPGSYQAALRQLKNAHPNWTFVPMRTGLDFQTSVSEEMGDRSLIQKTTANVDAGWVGDPCPSESGWNYATQPAVAYHMDPRNFLTENYIFQFEQLTFNGSYHTTEAVQGFLNSTFMKGKLDGDEKGRTYAQAFYEIGKNRKLSPIHLASRVYQEQGQGTSGLISGKYPGYEGYYNYFNVNVGGSSTEEKIKKGLAYAKSQDWNTRYKSLDGGAATIGRNYILKYQDTIYLEKFNVDKNSPYGLYNHQYMQNIQAPRSESYSSKKMYANAGTLNSAFVFKIPVYDNMPSDTYYPALKLDKTALTMNRSEDKEKPTTKQLIFYVDGVETDPAQAEWKSSDSQVAKVENGLITAVGLGEAVITASYQDVEVSCKVTVTAPLRGISLNKETVTLRRPDTVVQDTTGFDAQQKAENTTEAVLQVRFDPADTTSDKTIAWTSANQKIATVKADPEDPSRAVVTAVGTGEVKITAKASKAGNKAAVCLVKVIAPIYRLEVSDLNAAEGAGKTELFQGQSVSLSAEYWPKDTTSDTTVIWSSSNAAVAVVQNGRVIAKGAGTAEITAAAAGYSASYEVSVKACKVIFHREDGNVWTGQELSLNYGGCVADAGAFPRMENTAGRIFRGWYTRENGQGSVFTERMPVYAEETHIYPHYQRIGAEQGFYVVPLGDQTYTGSALKPKLQVFDSTVAPDGSLITGDNGEVLELVEGRDYTLSYKNNKNVNAGGKARPTVTVKGKGNYTGTQQVFFDIVPKALTDTDIAADDITVAYNGKTIKSAPTVWRDGRKLKKNTDYAVAYPQSGAGAYQTAGVYPIVITGKGGYRGTITVYETITKKTLMSKVSVAKIPNQTYNKEQLAGEGGIRPETLKVTYKKETLVESTDGGRSGDYTVTYRNDTAIGTATATITAVEGSAYTGSKSVTYKIVGTSLSKAKVEGLENKEYVEIDRTLYTETDGYEKEYRKMLQTPGAYRLILNDQILKESEDGGKTGDYLVSYAGAAKRGAAKAGTATIIFQGINAYTGQIRKTYKILPCALAEERIGAGRDFTLFYHTQDEPEREIPLTGLDGVTTPYVKGGSKPVIGVKFRGQTLAQGKDYTVSYKNNNALTTADTEEKKLPVFTISGKGNFKGKLTGNFMITDGRFDREGKVGVTVKDVVYREKKNAYKSKITLKDVNGVKLAAGRDYDKNLRYAYAEDTKTLVLEAGERVEQERKAGDIVGEADIPRAGTKIRVTAGGMGAYAGKEDSVPEISAVYRIVAADIAKAKVKVAAVYYRDGRPVTLTAEELTLTMSGAEGPLEYGRDYVIDETSYVNNATKGKAKVTLRGLENYGGEKTITYAIGAKKLWWQP